MNKSALILICTVLVTACGKGSDKTAVSSAPAEIGMPLETSGQGGSPEIVRMHKIAGRWESQPGVMASSRNEWLSLNVSGDGRFSLETHAGGQDKTLEIGAVIQGPIAWTKEGILTGQGTGAKGPLRDFGKWRASFPSSGHMRLVGSGKSYDLTYRGL